MVLILLSTPNHANSFFPSTPRSFDISPPSPRTPLTPSPSFFAILSPIFPDDATPPTPGGLRQVSPGMIPPETPPPWLLGPQSPATPVRPIASRASSYLDSPRKTLSRVTTGEGLMQVPQPRQRPGLPSTTFSFSTGHAQAFRPPPLALKRTMTEPFTRGSSSSLRQTLTMVSKPLPELTVRPPSREQVELGSHASTECESMDIPIALESPTTTGASSTERPSHGSQWQTISRSKRSHFRSPSAPVFPQTENITISWSLQPETLPARRFKPLELTSPKSSHHPISVSNLQQLDQEMGTSHIVSRCELR